MWNYYRKTLIPVQACIIVACLILYLFTPVAPSSLLTLFCVMEVASLFGARWGAKLSGRYDKGRPLAL